MRELSAKHRREVVNGFQLVGYLLLGFVTMVLLLLGTVGITGGDTGRVGKVGAYLAYAAGITVLYVMAEKWKVWIAGFFGLPGLWNSWIVLSTGHSLHWPYTPIPLRDRLFMVGFCAALSLTTFPSPKWRKPFDLPNRLFLVAGVLAFFLAWVSVKNYYAPLVVALALFSAVRLRLSVWKKTPHRRVTAEQA
jgi:hypothetical protein